LQVNAIVTSIKNYARKNAGIRPLAIDGEAGMPNGWLWTIRDVLVHVFLPERREVL
jgi:ribosomal silencing factor RsfS